MSVRQDKARKTWMAKVSYMDDLGVRRYKTKRGFKTKREAKDWESEFLKKIKGSSDMTFVSLVEVYGGLFSPIKANNVGRQKVFDRLQDNTFPWP